MKEDKTYYTTTQAAERLSVSPDTVLKWVKAGKIGSYRTLGGHFRIPRDELTDISRFSLELPGVVKPVVRTLEDRTHQYCWEYLSHDGRVRSECKECITYRSRSKRCYELKDLPEGMGCLLLYCSSSCEDCDYFMLVNDQVVNVLVFSGGKRLLRDPGKLEKYNHLRLEFVDNEYECSYKIEKFRPDYIVVDCAIGKRRSRSVCENFFNDPRIPVARIILSCRDKNLKDYCRKDVFGWIKKPFTLRQLQDCITGTA